MIITIPDKFTGNKEVFDWVRSNCEEWLIDAKELYRLYRWNKTSCFKDYTINSKGNVSTTKTLPFWTFIYGKVKADITYKGKKMYIKVRTENNEDRV